MSGHSKWHKIRHTKEVVDKKRSQAFGKLAQEIAIAARTEKDPNKNSALREVITRAKKANMPQANIDRLLSGKNEELTSVTYEAVGPGGCAILITTNTNNTNRTVSELKTILKNNNGTLADQGSAKWKFTASSETTINETIPDMDSLELTSIDHGATDIKKSENKITITAPIEATIETGLQELGITSYEKNISFIPNIPIQIQEEHKTLLTGLLEALESHPDVQEIFTDVQNL